MSKPKIRYFRYKSNTDVYISNMVLPIASIKKIAHLFFEKEMIVIIDTEEDIFSALSQFNERVRKAILDVSTIEPPIRSLAIAINQADFDDLIDQLFEYHIEGVFLADFIDGINIQELLLKVKIIAPSMVKREIASVTVSINMPENELIVSVGSTQDLVLIEDKIQAALLI